MILNHVLTSKHVSSTIEISGFIHMLKVMNMLKYHLNSEPNTLIEDARVLSIEDFLYPKCYLGIEVK